MTAAVELRDLGKRYGQFQALQGLSLRIEAGEIIGLLGHNGAGKTTTMKLILGLIEPTSGELRVFGEAPSLAGGEQRRQTGFLPENVNFYRQLSGREVLVYFARLKGVAGSQVDALLERVGLAHAADRRVKTYSKGMRQRLGLAQALLGEPRLLLLDEPTAGLDPAATRDFYETLDELRGRGTTVLLSSHVLPGVEGHIDRAAILAGGRLLAAGSLDELRREAGLPLGIRVRGRWQDTAWTRRLAEAGIEVRPLNGQRLEFSGPEERKLFMLRTLVEVPGVEDIDLRPPSLEDLYAYFNRRAQAAPEADAPCTPS